MTSSTVNRQGYKATARALEKAHEAAQIERYQRWQHNYSIHVIQQFAVMGDCEALLVDLIPEIKRSKYYRQQVKKATNKLDPYYVEKWHNDFAIKDSQNLMNSMIDCAVKSLQKVNTQFYYAIKQAMDNDRLENSAFKAKVYLAMTLMDMSCYMFDLHTAIGPHPKELTDDQVANIRQMTEDYSHHRLINSPWHDPDYTNWMKGCRSTANQKAMKVVFDAVIGKWRHTAGGNITTCMKIIFNRVSSDEWINKMALDGLIDSGSYERELTALHRMHSVKTGDVDLTLDLLDSVRMYLEGMSDEAIRKELMKLNPNAKYMPKQFERNMDIIKLMRLMDEHPEAQQMFNELEDAFTTGGREKAEKIHRERMDRLDHPEKYAEPIDDEAPADPMSEMMQKLQSKFGKVSKFKDKKPHSKKSATTEHFTDVGKMVMQIDPGGKRKHSRRWEDEEVVYLKAHWYDEGMTAKKMSSILKYRTEAAVQQKVYQLRMKGELHIKTKVHGSQAS